MRLKPGAKRMQIDVPLHRDSPNYNRSADKALQLDSIALVSSLVDMGTTHALGCVRCVLFAHPHDLRLILRLEAMRNMPPLPLRAKGAPLLWLLHIIRVLMWWQLAS